MCYYISITLKPADLQVRFGAKFKEPGSFQPVYSASAFTYPEIPVISTEDRHYIQYNSWGLIPHWVKDLASANVIKQRTLNARSETIFEKPSFLQAIKSKRCLILADGFFEWRHEKKKAYPYYIRLSNNSAFAIAGIWDTWTNPENSEMVKTCSVITTAANTLLEKVHNTRKRMPVILRKEQEDRWLEEDLDEEQIRSMLVSYDSDEMDTYPVSNAVNKLGFNTTNPEVIIERLYPELPAL